MATRLSLEEWRAVYIANGASEHPQCTGNHENSDRR
jgi:hypothetical protein